MVPQETQDIETKIVQAELETRIEAIILKIPSKQAVALFKDKTDEEYVKLLLPDFMSKNGVFVQGFTVLVLIKDFKRIWFNP